MSKINAVRLINLNYNNNAIRVSDETFQFKGESTLLSLRNGGGKSVLVQMMMAPFVHRRYLNAKDRLFSGYFTTAKPTFILVEWLLDQGAGYVLTGMMVRRSQEIAEESQDELEMVNFIAEYRTRCQQDIYHLPVVERTKKDVTLKGFAACKQMFEGYKRERGVPFFYYDMNNASQSRQYFSKLAEYRIHYKEWETIIKKVNMKESGLSDLFADCKDEKGLVEKWFLEAVEDKLNQDRNRMKEFQDIMEKYTGQYKDNRSKIQRRDTIRVFNREAERVREHALSCRDEALALEAQQNRIADFLYRLHEQEGLEHAKEEAVRRKTEELERQLNDLEYEKLSGEFYEIADRENFARSNLEILRIEEEGMERREEELRRSLRKILCAKQREKVEESAGERDQELQRLSLCREKRENLEPERMHLGILLKQHYNKLLAGKGQERELCLGMMADLEQKREESRKKLEELRGTESGLTEESGALRARIRGFDETEDRFNQEYREEWSRNLLGEYEAGALSIRQAEYEKELGDRERDRTAAKKDAESAREQARSLRRLVEDRVAERSRLESAVKENGKLLKEYGEELAERGIILRYFGIGQEEIFDRDKILATVQRKLLDTDLVRQGLEREADGLEKEYRKMSQGQVLELSEEFRGMLEEAGLHFVYGMEWLRKNGLSPEKNKEIVAARPFLPYSLVLSGQELEKLSNLPEQVYTSFPIPILVREELEGACETEGGAVRSFGRINFYVWFNDNLLDEERLAALLAEREARIWKLRKAIETKKNEYMEYVGHQEKIKAQKVTAAEYEAAKGEAARLEQRQAALEQEILRKREELESLEIRQAQREQQAAELEKEILYQSRRLADFGRFSRNYEEYRENCRLLERRQKERERILNLQKLEKDKILHLEQNLATERNRLAMLEREAEGCQERLLRYRQYPDPTEEALPQGRLSEKEAKEAENRYEVITGGISAEQRELEERAEKAQRRCAKEQEELRALAEKYRLPEEEWTGIRYDRKEETHQESLLEEQGQKRDRQKGLIRTEEIQCALLGQERQGKLVHMRERCRKEEPLARGEIRTVRYDDVVRKLEYEKNEAEKEGQRIQKRLQSCESSLAALAEYEELARSGPAEWEFDFSALTGAELARQKGILVRDYNACTERRREACAALERVLNRMIRMENFAEDFYRKPLESLLQLVGDAERVLRQLETTTASYNSLMEKLQVDISLVEKEQARIVELVGDYLREVHGDLNKIDRNSTITVRERPVKMLKIELPDWTENESVYGLRLRDYIDDVTARGIALLEENGNVQEFLGARITTRGLYDAVVGIGNVQIRLYKIEAQREYPITWAEVAKNSGGEGFLSAFVILSALLYYMRRDESDIFADRNEGKVLLMDNPFAQTNAAHLLKPLMDMAKKSNTQLICLSGLGGESIYSRFDNIYVLTLIAASLRNDMQYLKSEHMRGSEEETILAARIEVMEQQEFLF